MYNASMKMNEINAKLKCLLENVVKTDSKISYLVLPLHKLSEKILVSVDKVLEERHQLSYSEFDALVTLKASNENTLSPTELYTEMTFSSGGMTKLLKKLESKQYVIRINNINDGRSKLVQLTKMGDEVMQHALKDIIAIEEKILTHISEDEKETLTKLLIKAFR